MSLSSHSKCRFCQAFGGQQARGNAACGQAGIEEAGVFVPESFG